MNPLRVQYDFPSNGRRLMQDSEGYVATIVSGVVVRENGVSTADLPGRLVRGVQQPDQIQLAAE